MGRLGAYALRAARLVGSAVSDFGMTGPNEGILAGISGGKDSLALAFLLAKRRERTGSPGRLEAAMVEWEETPFPPGAPERVEAFLSDLGIGFTLVRAGRPSDHGGDFTCYACSRERRKLLFGIAEERGLSAVALGHHADDVIETALANLSIHGRFESFPPVRRYFDGSLKVIRPLYRVPESVTRRLSEEYGFPVIESTCPLALANPRVRFAEAAKIIHRGSKRSRRNFLRAIEAASAAG